MIDHYESEGAHEERVKIKKTCHISVAIHYVDYAYILFIV